MTLSLGKPESFMATSVMISAGLAVMINVVSGAALAICGMMLSNIFTLRPSKSILVSPGR